MVWNIGLSGNDYKILNSSSNISSYNSLLFLDYFTITESGNVGINNGTPKRKLDVNGDIFNNGILISSNILGYATNSNNNTSNYLLINYNSNVNNSRNNILEIYGNSLFRGNVGIGTLTPKTTLDVNGSITASQFIGTGSNIFNINASNINAGTLNALHGGTGVTNIIANQILIGDNNKIRQTQNLIFEENILKALFFQGNGSKLTSIDANSITQGIMDVSKGGTGITRYNVKGGVLIANLNDQTELDRTELRQSSDLKWNNTSNAFEINGHIKIPANSNILIGGLPLNYNVLGDYRLASCNIAGIVKLSGQFKMNSSDELTLADTGSSKWGQINDIIYYPPLTPTSNHCVGIGIVPLDNTNRLIVDGDVNIVNGAYKINGVDIDKYNSNIISQRITNLTLDNINELFCGKKNRCFTLRTNTDTNVDEYQIGAIANGTLENNNSFRFLQEVNFNKGLRLSGGTFDIGTSNNFVLKSLVLTGANDDQMLGINQTNDVGNLLTITKNNEIRTIITNNGNMGLGNFTLTTTPKFLPLEKLHVIGNVIATGTITSYYSDERLKIFTSNIYNSLDIINNLNGYYYLPNKEAINAGFENEKQIGLSAQEVQKVLPEIVKIAPFDMFKDENGNISSKSGEFYLTICYERLAPVFVEAIKELTSQIKELKKENKLIKKELDNIKKIIATNYLN
jgi:hypothetical protein